MAPAKQAPYLFPDGAKLGSHNVVLHARAKRHQVDSFAGPLSIKTVLNGNVCWLVNGRELVVDRSSFLILNAGDAYSMNIDSSRAVETCCVFFAPGFVERVALDLTSPLDAALDQPDRTAPGLPYLSALHADHERSLGAFVQSLAARCKVEISPSGFEEDFLRVANQLLEYYEQMRDQAARIPAVRASTRQELFSRLLIGREVLHSQSTGSLSLETVARAACLSPFHFHRGFTSAFQLTPHVYLTKLRLERARKLIESGCGVLDSCLEVGFASPSAFARLFRSHYGETPNSVRKKFARSGKNIVPASDKLGA